MTDKEYKQKKRECLLDFCKEHCYELTPEVSSIFCYAFDRAYTLGKQTETISQEEIESHSVGYATDVNNARLSTYPEAMRPQLYPEYDMDDLANAFEAGANFALGKQETKQETNSFQNGNTSNYSVNHFADVRKMVDTRLHIAAMCLQGMLSAGDYSGCPDSAWSELAKTALACADALLVEAQKGDE